MSGGLHPQWRPVASLRMPDGQDHEIRAASRVVDVISRRLQKYSARTATGDRRYDLPIRGELPIMSNAAASSLRNRSGDERRFARHQSSISRICWSASGVVRTAGLTGGGGVRLGSLLMAAIGQLQPISTTLSMRHEGGGVLRR
jgi:hypothetical protein